MTRVFDLFVVAAYLAFMAGLGIWFSRRQTSTENYFVAKRSLPSWAMGMSMLATMVSSVTFVAYPGSSYAKDWSLLVPGFLLTGTASIRRKGDHSLLSGRSWHERVRVLSEAVWPAGACLCGNRVFTRALQQDGIRAVSHGIDDQQHDSWNIVAVIVAVAIVMVFYTVIGGIEAVVWSDVIQGFVMWIGIAVALGLSAVSSLRRAGAVLGMAAQNGKFALGSSDFDFTRPTIPVAILYGLFWYGQRYVADQTMVQRYLLAKSDRGAMKGVAHGCVSVRAGVGVLHADWNVRMVLLSTIWRGHSSFHHESRSDVPVFPQCASSSWCARACCWPP